MGNLNTFQIVILGVFIAFAVLGVVLFAGFGGFDRGGRAIGDVEIWGTLPREAMERVLEDVRAERDDFAAVRYVEKRSERYGEELAEALAAGRGPDLFLLPSARVLSDAEKISPIPFETFSERDFRDAFVEAGEIYLSPEGALALPFLVDPLVLYVNRTLLSGGGVARPPAFWDELFTVVPRLTSRDPAGNVLSSGVALGEWGNVANAKDILAGLILQAGNPIVRRTDDGAAAGALSSGASAAEAAVRFFTEFSNPVRSVYSWNRSLRPSREAFLAGRLALYIGFASELPALRAGNPNLNVDVAPLPQSRDAASPLTPARLEAFAIPKASGNPPGALEVARVLSGPGPAGRIAELLNLPPVRRDLLAERPTDAYRSVFRDAALMAATWLDPKPAETDRVFRELVESVTTGRSRVAEAVRAASDEIDALLAEDL